ncbi:MAG: ribonuclease HIII [Planctomycetes bacterium]|nr:ribonuclease HIII [Planctomycetota bacterium]MCB9905101.1 ribonuclease HIII [Planctomycetota bacterium]
MSQRTLVLKVTPAERSAIRQRLGAEDFEFRTVPHALFSARGCGVVATLYKSGKFVIQGADPDVFVARYVEGGTPVASKAKAPKEPTVERVPTTTLIGSDECGKGDYFGPLVVCAVRLDPEASQKLSSSGVVDSKKLTDDRALQLGAALRKVLPYSIQRLDPPRYNEVYAKVGNVNLLLADLHAAAIRELASPGMNVLIDQFAKTDLFARRLGDLKLKIEQRPRAEENLAVAAASIIARAEFLVCLDELSSEATVKLRKGAGFPTDNAGVEYARLHGFEALPQVAKMHFKNTDKIRRKL